MLYIDCGHTASRGDYTGIQRYVRHTLRQAQLLLGSDRVAAVRVGAHGWTCLPSLAAHPLEGLPAVALEAGTPVFDARSHVLLADRFWHTGAWGALETLLASKAQITTVVYDLLSLQQPGWFPDGVGERFGRYLRRVLPRADSIVCLSAAVRADLAEWMRAEGMAVAAVKLVAPGHRVWTGEPQVPPSLLPAWRNGKTPVVLQVGTLEPRKNHAVTLEAMRQLWAKGLDIGCLFIGQRGWMMDSFVQEMIQLPQWQRRLLWLSECSDAQLDWCYRHAAVVVYPSASEGYGLPLAEAVAAGARVVASDTPVHREVARVMPAGSRVTLCDAQAAALSAALRMILSAPQARPHLGPGRDWPAATAELLASLGFAGASTAQTTQSV